VMRAPPAGIPDPDWLLWPPEDRHFILARQQETEQLRGQLAALAIELTQLRERIVLHRLVCPCCSTSTCATLPADVEASRYGPRLSALVGLLGSAFPLSCSKTQALLDQLLGVGDLPWGDRHDPPALERSTGAAYAGGPCVCPSATGGLCG